MAAKNYRTTAEQMVDPSYNSKLASARASLDQSLNSLDSSKGAVEQNYALEREDINRNNNLSKNNYSNTTLGRGMGRSTIASSGLAGFDFQNNRNLERSDMRKTGELNNIETQKNILNQNYGNTVNALNADRESGILSMAEQLRQRDEDVSFRNRQLQQSAAEAAASRAFQREQLASENAWKQKSYALDEKKLAASSTKTSDPSSKESQNALESAFYTTLDDNPGQARKMLESNKSDIISRYGASAYKSLMKDLEEREEQRQYELEEMNSKTKGNGFQNFLSNTFDNFNYRNLPFVSMLNR